MCQGAGPTSVLEYLDQSSIPAIGMAEAPGYGERRWVERPVPSRTTGYCIPERRRRNENDRFRFHSHGRFDGHLRLSGVKQGIGLRTTAVAAHDPHRRSRRQMRPDAIRIELKMGRSPAPRCRYAIPFPWRPLYHRRVKVRLNVRLRALSRTYVCPHSNYVTYCPGDSVIEGRPIARHLVNCGGFSRILWEERPLLHVSIFVRGHPNHGYGDGVAVGGGGGGRSSSVRASA